MSHLKWKSTKIFWKGVTAHSQTLPKWGRDIPSPPLRRLYGASIDPLRNVWLRAWLRQEWHAAARVVLRPRGGAVPPTKLFQNALKRREFSIFVTWNCPTPFNYRGTHSSFRPPGSRTPHEANVYLKGMFRVWFSVGFEIYARRHLG